MHIMAAKIIRIIYFGFILILSVQFSNSLNLGLISGDLKRTSSPFIIKKSSHHSPITINIRSESFKPQKLIPPKLPPILSLKSSPIKTKLKKSLESITSPKLLKSPKISKLPKLPKLPKTPKLLKLPKLSKLPLLPLIPPLLPPIIPTLPLLPLPILPILPPLLPPILPSLTKLRKPIRVPIIGKTKLQTALGSELKPLKVPPPKSNNNLNKKILEKLLKLKKDGSLTTAQFMRFKKILLSFFVNERKM